MGYPDCQGRREEQGFVLATFVAMVVPLLFVIGVMSVTMTGRSNALRQELDRERALLAAESGELEIHGGGRWLLPEMPRKFAFVESGTLRASIPGGALRLRSRKAFPSLGGFLHHHPVPAGQHTLSSLPKDFPS